MSDTPDTPEVQPGLVTNPVSADPSDGNEVGGVVGNDAASVGDEMEEEGEDDIPPAPEPPDNSDGRNHGAGGNQPLE